MVESARYHKNNIFSLGSEFSRKELKTVPNSEDGSKLQKIRVFTNGIVVNLLELGDSGLVNTINKSSISA